MSLTELRRYSLPGIHTDRHNAANQRTLTGYGQGHAELAEHRAALDALRVLPRLDIPIVIASNSPSFHVYRVSVCIEVMLLCTQM